MDASQSDQKITIIPESVGSSFVLIPFDRNPRYYRIRDYERELEILRNESIDVPHLKC